MNLKPKVGDKIHAVYIEGGREVRALSLGNVTKINKKKKTFIDGHGNERGYTFAVSNGVKLNGFTTIEKEVTEENGD